jgi:hypothetical protein
MISAFAVLRAAAAAVGIGLALAASAQSVFVNEIHYDNASTDTGERIEVAGPAGTDLTGWSLVLYNGNGGAPYATLALSGTIPDQQDGFGTRSFAAVGLQNGAPDGIALVDSGGAVVQFLSYEGGFTAVGGPANGLVSVDIGVAQSGSVAAGNSLRLTGSGRVYADFAWVGEATASFDAVNPGQTFTNPSIVAFGNCGDPATRIHIVQGGGAVSPLAGQVVVVEGVVVATHQGASGLGGFYLQEEDDQADADANTSEGIFVFDGSFGVSVSLGDVVRVRGTAVEFATGTASLTELTSVRNVAVCDAGRSVTPASVTLPVADRSDWERYEGMLVTIPQALVVTEVFTLGRFGEVSLAPMRLMQPTVTELPGAAALARQSLNDRSRILLDDANTLQNIEPVRYPAPGGLSAANTLRVGYLASNAPAGAAPSLTAVLDHRFDAYRLQPVAPSAIAFAPANPRPPAPAPVAGTLRVASFNLLNYFTTLDNAGPICGPAANQDCRGADSALEFSRQRAKILGAIRTLGPHVAGLIELENNAAASLQDLVDGLNALTAPGTYAFVSTGTIGADAIKLGFIYQPGVVTPVGSPAILDNTVDIRAISTLNRPALAQTFRHNASGESLTVVVNHFKSKGSACDVPANPGELVDPDALDGQGNCNLTRSSMANALKDWLAADPTRSGDPDFLIIGDLNAYAREDPIRALEAAGYTNLIRRDNGDGAYSYVFQGQSGYLDHALATASLRRQVTGVTEWHINADEPVVLDYNTEFKTPGQLSSFYSPEPYRSSDHDPLLIGLNLLCGDLNDDNRVDALDRALWRGALGTCSADARFNRRADLDESGCINYTDYALWYGCFQRASTPR